MAASQLSGSNKKKIDDGRKRQRLGTVHHDKDTWSFLKPLLSSLESALHADAVEGGKWVRHDDSERYHSLLLPLSELLEVRSPSTSDESEPFYQQIVHGIEGETGSVIGCLTALASAAGNEQLWKPLNHSGKSRYLCLSLFLAFYSHVLTPSPRSPSSLLKRDPSRSEKGWCLVFTFSNQGTWRRIYGFAT